jgi:hypothetical protein
VINDPTVPAAEVEKLSPDERARLVNEHSVEDLSELDPAFRARVEAKGRRLLEERGLLDTEPR